MAISSNIRLAPILPLDQFTQEHHSPPVWLILLPGFMQEATANPYSAYLEQPKELVVKMKHVEETKSSDSNAADSKALSPCSYCKPL